MTKVLLTLLPEKKGYIAFTYLHIFSSVEQEKRKKWGQKNSCGGPGGGRGGGGHLVLLVTIPSVVIPAPLCFYYCKILHTIAKLLPYFSQFLPPWEPRFLFSLLPPPVDFLPPFTHGLPQHLVS